MLIIFLVVFINLVGFGIIIPLLPFYGERFGAAPDTVTLLLATYSATQFVTAPLWGRLSDRYGRRPILLFCLAGTVIAYVWLAFAGDLQQLFWARATGGIMAGSIGVSFAYVADITTEESRSRGMGIVGAAFGLGFVAGPAIGGLLAGGEVATADFRSPSLAAAGFSAGALILAIFILKESLPTDVRRSNAAMPRVERRAAFLGLLRDRQFLLVLALSFLAVFVFAGLEATFALWTERAYGWGPRQNGYVFAFIGVIIAVIQGTLIGPMTRILGERGMVVHGFAVLAVGLAILPFMTTVVPLLVSMSAIAYGFSVSNPALNSLLSFSASKALQGGALGIGRAVTTFSRVVGPPWAGVLFVGLGRDWPFYIGAVTMVLVTALALSLPRRTSK
jgi:DHA1 family tetracycline resistance protein-like MFS transporter